MRAYPAILCVTLLSFAVPAFPVVQTGTDANTSVVGMKIGNLVLEGVDGKKLTLDVDKNSKATVVVFLTFDCPVSTSYIPSLKALVKKYETKQVRLLAVSPSTDTAAALAKMARDYDLTFSLYRDADLKAAKQFQAQTVPEAFVLDDKLVVRYQGRIDDTYLARLKKKSEQPRQDLDIALTEILDGKAVSLPSTKAIGCPIVVARPPALDAKVTYQRDVLPILQKHCQSCHRPGEVGPFSLMTYAQAVKWADDIKSYTQSRQMPPWTVSESVPFQNERTLTDKEIAALAAWADAGAPAGDPKEAPPPRQFTDGWHLGEPDLVLEPDGEMTLAADGPDLFRCFVLPTNLKEDKFVTAYEVRPGNRKVVHHTLHFLDGKQRGQKLEKQAQANAKKDARDFGPGYSSMMGPGFFPPSGDVGGWAPGMTPRHFPKGVGYYLPKGTDVVMQVHYHRTGRVEKDRTKLGLYFAKAKTKAIQPIIVPGWITWIPANAANHPVKGSVFVAQDCTIYSITPHMHLLGKSIKVTMTPPNAAPKTLIRIDQWDFNWQETYFFRDVMHVKAGTKFTVEAVYDNSTGNPNNPFNPPRTIFPGEQTTNEMCFGFLDATTDDGSPLGLRLTPNGFTIHHLGVLPKMP